MASQKQLSVLQQGIETCNAWRTWQPAVFINLNGADLRGVDLRGVDLREADLSGANLNGANLNGVNLNNTQE